MQNIHRDIEAKFRPNSYKCQRILKKVGDQQANITKWEGHARHIGHFQNRTPNQPSSTWKTITPIEVEKQHEP